MRVIAGSAKGIKLAGVPGKSTRPITDRVKEALFNILGPEVIQREFLDLFGGTGAVGIEALSRGANHAVFLDINYRAYQVIKQNLKATRLEKYATVLKKDAFAFLREDPRHLFDFIYIAPPQYQDLWHRAMLELDLNPGWLDPQGMIIVQIHPKEFHTSDTYANFTMFDRREYGDTTLVFYQHILS